MLLEDGGPPAAAVLCVALGWAQGALAVLVLGVEVARPAAAAAKDGRPRSAAGTGQPWTMLLAAALGLHCCLLLGFMGHPPMLPWVCQRWPLLGLGLVPLRSG